MIGYTAVMATGYVLGTKAGRQHQQIVNTYRAIAENPATKSVIDAGRRKIAERVSPDPQMVELTEVEIDVQTTVIRPENPPEQALRLGAEPLVDGGAGHQRAGDHTEAGAVARAPDAHVRGADVGGRAVGVAPCTGPRRGAEPGQALALGQARAEAIAAAASAPATAMRVLAILIPGLSLPTAVALTIAANSLRR